jgi:hypothetical protein
MLRHRNFAHMNIYVYARVMQSFVVGLKYIIDRDLGQKDMLVRVLAKVNAGLLS